MNTPPVIQWLLYLEVCCGCICKYKCVVEKQPSWVLEGLCCSTLFFKIPQRYVILDLSQATYLATFFFFKKCCIILAVCFESLSCWNIYLLPVSWRLSHLVSQYFAHAFMVLSKNTSSPPFCTHAAPYHHTPTSVLHCRDYTFPVVVLARLAPNMLDPIWAKQMYLGLIWPKNLLPIFIRLLFMFFTKV